MHPDMFNLINSMQGEQAEMYSKTSNDLNDLLEGYSPVESSLNFSALLLHPSYQSTTATLEKAVHTCLGVCQGKNVATKSFIKSTFQAISSAGFGMMEDPAEDVMVSKLWFNGKDYKVLLGLWEGCIHQTQMFLNVLATMPTQGSYLDLHDEVEALLIASDEVLTNFNVPIDKVASEYPLKEISSRDLTDFTSLSKRLDVSKLNCVDKLPVLPESDWNKLTTEVLGKSKLEEKPFIRVDDKCYLVLPTAITIAIRRLIYSFCKRLGQSKLLSKKLALKTSERMNELSILGEFKGSPVSFVKRNNLDNWFVSQMSIEFDKGYFYQFIFVLDTLDDFDKEWFHGFLGSDENLAKFINSELDSFNEHTSSVDSRSKSCTFIVPCGFGRGFSVGFNPNDKNCLVEVLNANDLITLSQDGDCNPFRVWRLIEAQSLARKFGGNIQNLNGFLNLYGYIKQNDFSIFNHSDFIDIGSNSIYISIGTNFQKDVREKVLQDKSLIRSYHPIYGNKLVERCYANSFFKQNDAYDIFCPVDIDFRLLQAVFYRAGINTWIEMPIQDSIDKSLQAEIFKAYIQWLPKTINVLKRQSLNHNSIDLIRIEIDYPEELRKINHKVTSERVLDSSSYSLDENILDCHFDESLFHGFGLSTNCAEKALMKPFIIKACNGNKEAIRSVFEQVFESEFARYVHFFQSENYSENIVGSFEGEKPITLEIAADKNIKFGLGWINHSRPTKNIIEGKDNCKKYIAKVVSNLWDKTQSSLSKLNKKSLVEQLFRNIELCELHRTRWTKSFKANMYLQQDQDDLYQVASKEVGLLTGATLASRLLIEMAICEADEDAGKQSGIMDIQELQSYALSLHLLGGVSEAINYDAIKPKLHISHFGDILYDHDFEDLIVNRYQLGLHKNKFNNAAKKYKDSFSPKVKSSAEDVENAFDTLFWEAWSDEFGFTPNEGIDFINALQNYGFDKNELIFELNKEQLTAIAPKFSESILKSILDCLTLKSRKKWTDIPKPYKSSDWQPWRFKRNYSLAFKPLVYLSEKDMYIVSPEQVRRGYMHLLMNTHDATIDESHFYRKKMITWNGSKRAESGLEFNSVVANIFDQNIWCTEEEVKLTKVLNKKLKDFGDIDVLAWHKTKNLVLAIECKDLEMAKNQSEIARQLYEFKGKVNSKGKSDRLHKHILRMEQLTNDLQGLGKYVKKKNTDEIQVVGLVVFSSLVPMNFISEESSEVIFTNVDELLSSVESI